MSDLGNLEEVGEWIGEQQRFGMNSKWRPHSLPGIGAPRPLILCQSNSTTWWGEGKPAYFKERRPLGWAAKKHSSHPFPHLLVGNSLVSVYEAMGIVVGESHRIASPLLRGHEYSCSLLKAGLTDCKQTKILRLCISRNNSAEKNDELSTCIQPKKESAVHGEEGEGIV